MAININKASDNEDHFLMKRSIKIKKNVRFTPAPSRSRDKDAKMKNKIQGSHRGFDSICRHSCFETVVSSDLSFSLFVFLHFDGQARSPREKNEKK